MKSFYIFILFWLCSAVAFGQTGQHLPYPVIFIHGLNSDDNTAWDDLKIFLQSQYNWSYGGNMDFNLNYDGNNKTSVAQWENDMHDFWDSNNPLPAADFYTINFNVDREGHFGTGSNLSNQAAIVKQGKAVGNAIKHVLEITGRDKVILVGHSMGGLAAREYLQNKDNWVEPGQHHVAKLLTIGTPHGGSNSTEFNLHEETLDYQSEAVRDLRKSYYVTKLKGVYLFGGDEELSKMKDQDFHFFYNADVNCNGNPVNPDDPGDNILGLNSPEREFPGVPVSCIIGTGATLGGDGVVSKESANLNNYYANVADTFIVHKSFLNTPLFHSELTKEYFTIIKGLDEPHTDDFRYAYNVDLYSTAGSHKWYESFITYPPANNPTSSDFDDYAVNITSSGKLHIHVINIPVSTFSVSVTSKNRSNDPCYTQSSNGASEMSFDVPISAPDTYYIVISGVPTGDSWLYPYSFELSFVSTTPVSGDCLTTLTTPKGTLGSLNYTNNMNCSWLIHPQGASSVTLHFNSFDTESINDVVSVYDGSDNTYAPLLSNYSGSSIPGWDYTSHGGYMFVEFKTNSSITTSGWDASYTSFVNNIPVRVPGKISGYRYWFDGDMTNGSTISVTNAKQLEVEKLIQSNNSLQRGFHTFSFMAKQTGDGYNWTAPVSGLFYYSTNAEPSTYEYWFDSLYNQKTTVAITGTEDFILSNEMLNAAVTQNGFHQINIRFKPNGGMWSPVQSHQFYRQVNTAINNYKYWFDNNDAAMQTVAVPPATDSLVITNKLLNASGLGNGFHQFNIAVSTAGGTWSSVQSHNFYLLVKPAINSYKYWFDNNDADMQTVIVPETDSLILTDQLLDASWLSNGFHQFNIAVATVGGRWSPVQSHLFYRQVNPAINSYKYWFDNDYASMQTVTVPVTTDSLVITNQLLDASGLSNGFHQFSIAVATVGGTWSSAQSHFFYKIQNPAINGYTYWFDNNYAGRQVVTVANTDQLIIDNEFLNASGLSNGFHLVHIGIFTVGQTAPRGVQTALFFKRGNDISAVMDVTKIRYWFNSDFSTANELNVSGQNGVIDNILECNSAPAGKNTISYQTMDNGNIWSSIVVDTFINAKCSPPVTPTITSKSATTFCQGIVDTLVSSNTAGNQWYLNGVKIDGAINTTYVVAASGVYTVVTTVNICSSAASSPVTITVNPLPATPVISWDNTQLSTAVGMATYQWYLNGNLITGANSNVYSPSSSGFYKVEVSNSSGCKAMSAGYNLVFTAVSDVIVNGVLYSLYPNPATKEATLKLSSMPLSKTTFTLVNSYGQKVLSRIITNQTETITVDHLPQGYYLIKVENKNHSGILKLIILR